MIWGLGFWDLGSSRHPSLMERTGAEGVEGTTVENVGPGEFGGFIWGLETVSRAEKR